MGRFVAKLRNYLDKEDALREVRQLSDLELSDLGFHRAELSEMASLRSSMPSQMLEMAKQFGLEERDLVTPRWQALEVIETCRTCSHADACFDYLIGHRSGEFNEAMCPNSGTYTKVSEKKRQHVEAAQPPD